MYQDLESAEAKIAWAAGFFEGEGCLSMEKGTPRHSLGYVYPRLRITQHYDYECLQWFQNAVGCGSIDGPRKNQKGQRVVYQYTVGGNRAIDVVKMLRPYLSDGGKGGQLDKILSPYADREWKVYESRV